MGETIRTATQSPSTPQASVVGGIIWTPIHIEKGSTMIRQALVAAAALALAVPADATAFAKKYGSNTQAKGKGAGADAFGKCVSAKATAAAQTAAAADEAAAKACKTELAAGATAFAAKYGTGSAKRNAFGKCVSAKTTAGH